MNTKQLKAKVLDLAIHGKLLSPETVAELKKSPDYETADVLLEKIRKEKEEKIAKGELKRDKKDSYIFVGDDKRHYEKFADGTVKDIEDEIPFDVPKGWTWCRLGDLCLFQNGYAFLSSKFSKDGKTKVIRISDITDGFVDESNCVFSLEEVEDDSFLVKKGDLLIAMSGATTGKNGIYNSDNIAYINQRVGNIKVRTPDALLPDFRNYYIQAMETEILKQAYGGAQPNISSTKILEMFFPLPPLIEQKEIVSKLEIAFEQIISIDANKNDLQIAIKKAKSKILDLAIHGKLVPQDTNDESASILLEKLRAEKEEKIAKGELKRDKNDSYIYKGSDNCYYRRFPDGENINITEEIPFEVPLNWTWTRIGEIASKITDGEHNTPKRVSAFQGFYLLSARNIQNGYISLNDVDYVDENEFIRIHKRCNPQKGDVLVSCSGSVGRCAVIEDDNKYVMVRSAAMISSNIINTKYLMYVIQSQELQNQIEDSSKQTAQANLFQAAIADLLIPLPPFNEQKRIVKNIEELYMKLELINQNID